MIVMGIRLNAKHKSIHHRLYTLWRQRVAIISIVDLRSSAPPYTVHVPYILAFPGASSFRYFSATQSEAYQGSCTGPSLPLSLPITTSQFPMSLFPLGAQYWPVNSIPKVPSTHLAMISAASSGGSAPPASQN